MVASVAKWSTFALLAWLTPIACDASRAAAPRLESWPSPSGNLSGMSYDGTSLWLTADGERTIYQVDPADGRVTRRVPIPIGATGGSAWDGRSLWQLAYEERRIYEIDLTSGRVLGHVPAPGTGLTSGMTFDGRYLWVASCDDKKLYQVDPREGGRVVRAIDGYYETTGLAWDGGRLWNAVLIGASMNGGWPRTGFVQQRNANLDTTAVVPVAGAGAGTSDWTSARRVARRLWWHDGYHNRIVTIHLTGDAADDGP